MGKVKNMAWEQATEFLGKIEDGLNSGKYKKEDALKQLKETNYNIALEGITSMDEAEEWVDIVITERQNEVQKLRTEAII